MDKLFNFRRSKSSSSKEGEGSAAATAAPAPPKKKCCAAFKEDWLKEIVETESQKSQDKVHVRLGEIFQYNADVGLICIVCAEAKVTGEFSTGKKWADGWKLDYMKRHLVGKVHGSAVQALRRKNSAEKLGFGLRSMLAQTSTERGNRLAMVERQRSKPEEVKVLLHNVLLAVKLNTSMLSVQEIHNHIAQYTKIPDSWRSKNYAFEFLESISSVIKSEILAEVRNAPFHTLIVDESTDISVSKMLVIYFKIRSLAPTPPHSMYKTVFGGIVKLTSCNAEAVTSAITEFYSANGLSLQNMVMFTSDGASVMLGKNNGVATRLKQSVPHLIEQHCVAHREELGIGDAWKKVPMIREVETLLRTVYSVFCRSPLRKSKFEEMASVIECDALSFRPLNEVRWLSRHFAVNALMRNYEVLLKYFDQEMKEENDPIAKYCFKKLSDPTYHISLAVLNDILRDLADLSKLLQKSSLTPIEAMQFARGKINQIRGQYLGQEVFWSSTVRDLISTYSDNEKDFSPASILSFIGLVCEHMEKRFPENELKDWASFDFDSLATQQCSFDFGIENVNHLVEKYKDILDCKEVDCLESDPTMLAVDSIVTQYNALKYVVAERNKCGSLKCFQDMVNFTLQHAMEYNVVAQLMDICATFQASSAECERGFSLMNSIKTKSRNRLEESHLDMLMRTKVYLLHNEVNLDDVYQHWKSGKDRREKHVNQGESDRSSKDSSFSSAAAATAGSALPLASGSTTEV